MFTVAQCFKGSVAHKFLFGIRLNEYWDALTAHALDDIGFLVDLMALN